MGNVILTGMPGAGKSTIGVVLAKIWGYQFIDSDLLIQAQEGKVLSQLIKEYGVEEFLQIENRVNAGIRTDRAVISTGGSICYCDEAMQHLKESGPIVYLKLDYKVIRRRVGSLTDRGVAMRNGKNLRDLYEERVPLYEKYADITVDLTGLRLQKSIRLVQQKVEEYLSAE